MDLKHLSEFRFPIAVASLALCGDNTNIANMAGSQNLLNGFACVDVENHRGVFFLPLLVYFVSTKFFDYFPSQTKRLLSWVVPPRDAVSG